MGQVQLAVSPAILTRDVHEAVDKFRACGEPCGDLQEHPPLHPREECFPSRNSWFSMSLNHRRRKARWHRA